MPYVKWSVLTNGVAEAHLTASGDQGREHITIFDRLAGKPVTAPGFHKETLCWISELSRQTSLKNGNGDPNFFERVDVR